MPNSTSPTPQDIDGSQKTAPADPDAQYRLAMAYIYGNGVPEDNKKAASLLTQAAQAGHREAIYNLGICYHHGYGVARDPDRAFALYQQAAEMGYAKGMHMVGEFYYSGLSVERDRAEAVRWFSASDALNDTTTLGFDGCYLGACCAHGDGVPRDPDRAQAYFAKAVAAGGEAARALIDKLMEEKQEGSA